MTDDFPRETPKWYMAKEIVILLSVLPARQTLQIDLTGLRGRDLRMVYREIRKTMEDKK